MPYRIKFPIEIYNGNCIADQGGHLLQCDDEDMAKTVLSALNALNGIAEWFDHPPTTAPQAAISKIAKDALGVSG